jgi:hypothetical protein
MLPESQLPLFLPTMTKLAAPVNPLPLFRIHRWQNAPNPLSLANPQVEPLRVTLLPSPILYLSKPYIQHLLPP